MLLICTFQLMIYLVVKSGFSITIFMILLVSDINPSGHYWSCPFEWQVHTRNKVGYGTFGLKLKDWSMEPCSAIYLSFYKNKNNNKKPWPIQNLLSESQCHPRTIPDTW